MSSKVHQRGKNIDAERLLWPQVGHDGNASDEDDPAARLAQAQQEAERRVQESRQAGFQDGLAAAKAEAESRVRELAERVAKTVAELTEIRPRLRRQAEADLLKLSLAIARRILHRELVVDPDALSGLVQSALEKLRSQESCKIRIHPTQEATLRAALERHPLAGSTEILADPALDRGTAIFETARGNLDASIETQLREIEQGLSDRLDRHS